MTLAALLPLIVAAEPAIASMIGSLLAKSTAPTQAEWDALTALCQRTAVGIMTKVLTDAGIDPTSPKGKAFIALVS
jgi:hypothetical protein